MPVMGFPSFPGVPWNVIAPHEPQAMRNHGGQSLERLAQRGGLGPCEALAVLEDRAWARMDQTAAFAKLSGLCASGAYVFTISRPNDDTAEYALDGAHLIRANHDEHGWSGMEAIEKTVKAIAVKIGARVEEVEA
jgi:hypothetical protein